MATTHRAGPALKDRIRREPQLFSFFQLVQLLLRQRRGSVSPGLGGSASRESIRFRSAESLAFAASDVLEIDEVASADGETTRDRVTVSFMGLYGPASPLPNHFTEDVMWAPTEQDASRDFLDLFNHRFISFVYRAWEKYRYPYRFDDSAVDEFTSRMLCLLGMGAAGAVAATGIARNELLRGAGLIASRHRSAINLEQFLRLQFEGLPIRVDPCMSRRRRIPREKRLRLGSRTARLNAEAFLGETIGDRSTTFRVSVGPMNGEAFRRFLPGRADLKRLERLIRFYVVDPLDFIVLLRLKAPDVTSARLDSATIEAARKTPLGHLSWLRPDGKREGHVTLRIRAAGPIRAAA